MYRLSSHITISTRNDGNISLKAVCNITVVETWRKLTTICSVTIPRKVVWKGTIINGNSGLFNEGDNVIVRTGYDDELDTVFTGYVKNVSAGFPIKFECEDNAYLLKRHRVQPKHFKTATLEELVKYTLPEGISYQVVDVNLGEFIIRGEQIASKVLTEITRIYNLPVFFRNNTLYAGLPYFESYQSESTFKFGFNIIKESLKYVKEEDVQLKIKAISIMANNTKYEVEEGDESGELRTFYFYNDSDTSKLKTFAKNQLKELKYTGLHGSFESFGVPFVQQGDIVNIIDHLEETKEREGSYLVEKVTRRFGYKTGYRQTIELGRKVACTKLKK